MKEEEARKKYCPMGGRKVNVSERDGISIGEFTQCIASDCMMWRWNRYEAQAVEEIVSRGDFVAGGYCGLTK